MIMKLIKQEGEYYLWNYKTPEIGDIGFSTDKSGKAVFTPIKFPFQINEFNRIVEASTNDELIGVRLLDRLNVVLVTKDINDSSKSDWNVKVEYDISVKDPKVGQKYPSIREVVLILKVL